MRCGERPTARDAVATLMAGVFQDFGSQVKIDHRRWLFVWSRPSAEMVRNTDKNPSVSVINNDDIWTPAGATRKLVASAGLANKFADVDF